MVSYFTDFFGSDLMASKGSLVLLALCAIAIIPCVFKGFNRAVFHTLFALLAFAGALVAAIAVIGLPVVHDLLNENIYANLPEMVDVLSVTLDKEILLAPVIESVELLNINTLNIFDFIIALVAAFPFHLILRAIFRGVEKLLRLPLKQPWMLVVDKVLGVVLGIVLGMVAFAVVCAIVYVLKDKEIFDLEEKLALGGEGSVAKDIYAFVSSKLAELLGTAA